MMKTIPPRKIEGKLTRVLKAEGADFVSRPVDVLEVRYTGIEGDFHQGTSRKSGSREPWYSRGTEMRNERQLSILSEEELVEIAGAMEIEHVDPGWIGANLVFEGIPRLSYLPPRTLILFEGGVTLRIDGYNAPCRLAGGSIATHAGLVESGEDPTRTDTAMMFKDAAHMKRGLVAWVEREGNIRAGESFTARIWEQWLYE